MCGRIFEQSRPTTRHSTWKTREIVKIDSIAHKAVAFYDSLCGENETPSLIACKHALLPRRKHYPPQRGFTSGPTHFSREFRRLCCDGPALRTLLHGQGLGPASARPGVLEGDSAGLQARSPHTGVRRHADMAPSGLRD